MAMQLVILSFKRAVDMARMVKSSLILILLLALPAMVPAWPVPDTGQKTFYNDVGNVIPCPQPGETFYGQDAQYAGPARSYTKLGQNGTPLSDTATEADGWIMTRDNVTGLFWEVKRNQDGTKNYTDPRDADNTCTWYDINTDTNGGYVGIPGDGTDTEDFINALNAQNFGGFSDWRMPTVRELSSLVNSGTYNPAVDGAWFPHTRSDRYWSSTASGLSTAWYVHFSSGAVTGDYVSDKSNSYYVRAVRAGQSGSLEPLVSNGDGTVTDSATGLMWQQTTAPGTYTWAEALSYCESLSLGGHSDWRLPNRNELQILVDYSRSLPAVDPLLASDTMSSQYWSSTTLAVSGRYAWRVHFSNGGVNTFIDSKSGSYYVRAVRAGPSGSLDPLVLGPSGGTTITTGAITFQWFYMTNATGYEIMVDNDPGFASPEIDGYYVDGATTTSITLQDYLSNDNYCWKVRAKYADGTYSDWSAVATFTLSVEDTTAPAGDITYSTTDPTNQDVEATLNPSEAVTVTNNGGLLTYIFTQNGEFTFEFQDGAGNPGSATATVDWIDKTPPIATVTGLPESPTELDWITLTIGGDDVVAYRFKMDDGSPSAERDVSTPIEETGISEGVHTISVIGKDAVGNWQTENNATVVSWEIKVIDPGDSNGDGEITLEDAILCLHIIVGIDSDEENVYKLADINGDLKIGMEEVLYILQSVVELK